MRVEAHDFTGGVLVVYRFEDGQLGREAVTQAALRHRCARPSFVAAGTRVHETSAVLDHQVLRPVTRATPTTALHL